MISVITELGHFRPRHDADLSYARLFRYLRVASFPARQADAAMPAWRRDIRCRRGIYGF